VLAVLVVALVSVVLVVAEVSVALVAVVAVSVATLLFSSFLQANAINNSAEMSMSIQRFVFIFLIF
jgi:hypothetical protein